MDTIVKSVYMDRNWEVLIMMRFVFVVAVAIIIGGVIITTVNAVLGKFNKVNPERWREKIQFSMQIEHHICISSWQWAFRSFQNPLPSDVLLHMS